MSIQLAAAPAACAATCAAHTHTHTHRETQREAAAQKSNRADFGSSSSGSGNILPELCWLLPSDANLNLGVETC